MLNESRANARQYIGADARTIGAPKRAYMSVGGVGDWRARISLPRALAHVRT
jgi:hypothetical protein